MTCQSLRAAMICALLVSAPLAAQTTSPPRTQEPPPPVEAPATQPPVERQEEPAPEQRYAWPVVSVFQGHTVRADERVRDLTVIMGDGVIEGRVDNDVLVVLGSAHLGSTASIGGSLVVVGGGVVAQEGARVRRELVVIGGALRAPATFSADYNQVVIGSPMLGELLDDMTPWLSGGLIFGRLIVPDLEWVWVIVAVFFVVYLLLNTVFHGPVSATADALAARPMSAFFGGLLILVLTIPVIAILAASVIGLAVVPFLLCALVVAGLVGKTAVARAMGRGVTGARSPEGRIAGFIAFVIGMVVLTLVYMVPVLGLVTWALTSVLGLGAATATFRGHLRSERADRRAAAAAAMPPPAPPPPAYAPAPPPPVNAERPSASAAHTPPAPAAYAVPAEEPSIDLASDPTAGAHVPPIPPPPLPPPPPPPVFTYGLAQYPRAVLFDRLAAFILDCILVAVATALLEVRGDDGWFWFLLLVYHIGFWAWKGTTLGGIVLNLKVTRTDGADLRFQDALIRGLSGIFSIASLGIGFFWMLQDPEGQTWHDKIAGTLVVKAPREVVLPQ
jgi:uncharacterized RDD family membrane protein YckC